VISQLQSDLANVLFDLNRAKRRVDTLEKSASDTVDTSVSHTAATSVSDTAATPRRVDTGVSDTRKVDLIASDNGCIDVRVTKRARHY
jgi:hypothetical protein